MDSKDVLAVNLLLRRIGMGEKDAMEVLFRQNSARLRFYAYAYLDKKYLADDVVSESMIRIAQYAHTFDASKNGFNWMIEIVKNVALNFNKSFSNEILSDLIAAESIADDYYDDRFLLKGELKKLNQKERHLIYLYFWKGLTLREIAKLLGESKSQIHRDLKKIMKNMQKNLKNAGQNGF